jgi:hypothetical protein
MHKRVYESQLNLSIVTFAAFFVMFVLSLLALVSHWLVKSDPPATNEFEEGFRAGFHGSAVSRALINVTLFGIIAAARRTKWTMIGAAILALLAGVRLCLFAATVSTWDEACTALITSMTRMLIFNKTTWSAYAFFAVVFYQMWRVHSLKSQEERELRQRLRDLEAMEASKSDMDS